MRAIENSHARKRFFILLNVLFAVLFFSCKSTDQSAGNYNRKKGVELVFLGDVMAHTGNFIMSDYDIIWDDIRDITSPSDFTFANIEAPVSNNIPFMNYPNFNMQYSYPQAAIDAGVNVMTVANNHTNDQFEDGIKSTYKWTKEISQQYKDSKRPVYFSGLKEDVSSISKASSSSCSYSIFEKNKIKILFLGVTQILNTPSCNQMINFFASTEAGKKKLIETVKKMREENPCDIFILAIHCDEPEYILDVKPSQKKLYYDLLNAGVDILWANHPHTPKPIEYISDKDTGKINKIIFYANGNTISAQRYRPNFSNPASMREYTGDGYCAIVHAVKDQDYTYFDYNRLVYITNIVDENKNILIKKLDQNLFDELEKAENKQLLNYLKKREELLKKIGVNFTCR